MGVTHSKNTYIIEVICSKKHHRVMISLKMYDFFGMNHFSILLLEEITSQLYVFLGNDSLDYVSLEQFL